MNIFHVNNRRCALWLTQCKRMGSTAWSLYTFDIYWGRQNIWNYTDNVKCIPLIENVWISHMMCSRGSYSRWVVTSSSNYRHHHTNQRWPSKFPDSKLHGANLGPIWGRQDPGGPHVGPMNFAIWAVNRKTDQGWIQIGESHWEVARECCEGFSPSEILVTPRVQSVFTDYAMPRPPVWDIRNSVNPRKGFDQSAMLTCNQAWN